MKNALNTFFYVLLSCVIISCASVKNENTDNITKSEKKIKKEKNIKIDSSGSQSTNTINTTLASDIAPEAIILPNQMHTFYYANSTDAEVSEDLRIFLMSGASFLAKTPGGYVNINVISYAPEGGSLISAQQRAKNAANVLINSGVAPSKIHSAANAYSDKNFDASADKSKLNNIQITIVSN